MIGNKCKNNENGLTLLGLIITIIVLLILAGVSIAMLTGENGIINKAKEHEIEAQLAIIEEAANIIYVEKNTLGIKNVELSDIVRQLQEDGYEIKVVFGDGVKEIVLKGPDIITIKKEYVIAVRPDEGDVEVSYYAVVKDKYFEIKNKDNGVEVVRTESDLSKLDDPNILSASTPNAGYININRIDQEEKKVIISGQNPPGREILTVTYGKKSAEKQIKVLSELEYLNEVVLKDYTEIPEDIKKKLAQEDYVVEEKTLTTIEDILLTSPEYMPIQYQSQITAEIKTSSDTSFYAVIDEEGNDGVDEYYKIVVKDGQVQAETKPTNVNNETPKLEANNLNGLITVGTIDGTTIPITSLNNTGLETITVKYGNVSKNCNIEVLSKLDYLDKLLEKEEDISDEIIDNVKDDGYTIEKITENKVTDISIVSPGSMTTNSTSQLSVTAQTASEISYYVLMNGKYYKLVKDNNKVIAEKTESTINDETFTLSATSNNSYVTIGAISGMNIQITSGSSKGKSTITVNYGGKTKSCEINVKVMPKEGSKADGNVTFSTQYGTIDVIWLDTSNNVINQPNEPVLAGMTPVTWSYNESTSKWIEDTTAQSTWYNYIAVDDRNEDGSKVENLTSMWANAKNTTSGGTSYFVWIPRYAYRITYYSSTTSTEPTGYYDGWGQWRASDGKIRHAIDTGVETVIHNGDKYIVHPAFETYLDLGGWDKDIAGFWFAKYEMSRKDASVTSSGSVETFRSVPNVRAWYFYDIKKLYTFGLNYDTSKQSHLMKNSEWGAVSYLAHSQYGRNGNQVYINNSSSHLTGKSGGTASATESSSSTANLYDTVSGGKASTTGNVYGVYDMSGCSEESVACWDTNTTSSYIKYGNTFATKRGKSTKYATAYFGDDDVSGLNARAKYLFGKVGDATKEVFRGGEVATTSTSNSYYYWYGDYYDGIGTYGPFVTRGYNYVGTSKSGLFCVESNGGSDVSTGSWRAVLCP